MDHPLPAAVNDRNRDYALVMLAAMFWGTSFPSTKLIVASVDPLFITTARLGIGASLGVLLLTALRRLDWRFFREPLVWGLGLVNAAAFELQNVGLVYTTASKTALLANVNVVFIPILMAVVFHERLRAAKAVGILVGLIGVVVLATKLNPQSLVGGEFLGDALVFGSSVLWSFFVVGTKEMVDRGGDYLALTTVVLATTGVFSAAPLLVASGGYPPDASSWGVVVYLGLVPTFLPLLLYTLSMRTISPTISSLLVLLEIVVAAVLSALFLREVLDVFTFLGGALILGGTYVVARGDRELPEPAGSGLAPVPRDSHVPGDGGLTRR